MAHPVVHDDDGSGSSLPAVELTISGDTWTRVDHLHGSRSYDLHYTAEADEQGKRVGKLVEYDVTERMFTNPSDPRTEGYITGRFG